jgi:hypothetical protein
MTENTTNGKTIPEIMEETTKTVGQQVKKAVAQGNTRHVVMKDRNGNKLFELNLTLAIVLVAIVFFTAFWALIAAAVVGYFMKLQIEIIREVNTDNDSDIIEV